MVQLLLWGGADAKRYPIEALAAVLEIQLGVVGAHQPGDPHTGMHALALVTGLSTSTLKRARNAGGFTEYQADRAAVAAGWLPGDVWSGWYRDGLGLGVPDAVGPVVGRTGRLVWSVAA